MKRTSTYPSGTIFGNYFLVAYKQDGQNRYAIRRRVTLPNGEVIEPRHPFKAYAHLKTKQELEQYVDRLNHRNAEEERLKRNINIRTSFIPESLMEAFRASLSVSIPSEKDFHYHYNTVLKEYFLGFFIGKLKILDPAQWYAQQEKWGAALLGKASKKDHNVFYDDRSGERKTINVSVKTMKKTIQTANRFMAFLHRKNPKEYPDVEFDPIGLGAMKDYEAKLHMQTNDEDERGKYIPESVWKEIEAKLPAEIKPFVLLMYHYGLRRSESLGFDSTDYVKKDHLHITQQMKRFPDGKPLYSPLKDREKRNTPHWFLNPTQTYNLIRSSLDLKCHPDTLYNKWRVFMGEMKMEWELHDFRRTFITNALRVKNPRDVQMAVGHASLETTMAYAQDDRALGNDIFVPEDVG